MKRKIAVLVSVLALIGLDQWVKAWTVANISLGLVKPFLPPLFSLTHLHNSGAAFSMLENQQGLFALITLVVMAGAGVYLYRHLEDSLWLVAGLVLIMAGGLGNFIDRLSQGYVVDMIDLDFMDFAIFNVADSYLTVGVFLLLIMLIKEEKDGN